MEDEQLQAARRALARIPVFPKDAIAAAHVTRLKGLTNRVYSVEASAARFCLRIPGTGSAAIIDRHAEETNARLAADAGVAPAVLHFDADGLMLTPLIEGAAPLSGEAFRHRSGAVERAAAALRQLHDQAGAFEGEFQAFATIDRYQALLQERGAPHRRLVAAVAEAAPIRAALALRPVDLKPCHCDPTGANLLDTGERVWLIDWEYSGMNDPMWDLAYLSLQSEFDAAMDVRLTTAYLGCTAKAGEASRMEVQKAACELLSAAWALLQESGGNRTADFRTYAGSALQRFSARIATPEFSNHLSIIVR